MALELPESVNHGEPPATHPLRSAKFGFAIGAILGAAGFSALRENYVREFGLLDSPKFSVIDSPQFDNAPDTYAVRLKRKIDQLSTSLATHSDAPHQDEWLSARLTRLSRQPSDSHFLNRFLEAPEHDHFADLSVMMGTPEAVVAQLFEKVTGQPMPSSIHVVAIDKASWPSDRYTGSNHLGLLGVSLACDQGYLDTLITCLHEVGHQICPVGEAILVEGVTPESVFAREEAAAYAFEFAAILHLEDPFLRDVLTDWFTKERDRNIERFFAGDTGSHAYGMMIADAALTIYRPDIAWQRISTGQSLDPRIHEVIAETKDLREKLNAYGSESDP